VWPSVPLGGEPSADALVTALSRFTANDNGLFWDLGGGLIQEQIPLVAQTAQVVHLADPQRPLGGDAWDGLGPYSLKLDLLGVHRWPLMTGLEIGQYRRWIYQRHFLTHEDTFTWTWVQTHLPDWYTSLVYKKPAAAGKPKAATARTRVAAKTSAVRPAARRRTA